MALSTVLLSPQRVIPKGCVKQTLFMAEKNLNGFLAGQHLAHFTTRAPLNKGFLIKIPLTFHYKGSFEQRIFNKNTTHDFSQACEREGIYHKISQFIRFCYPDFKTVAPWLLNFLLQQYKTVYLM